jgi:uncharacterized membrane protein
MVRNRGDSIERIMHSNTKLNRIPKLYRFSFSLFFASVCAVFGDTALPASLFSTIFIVGIITILGFLSKYFLGKKAIRLTEQLIESVPFVNSVYKTVKQIVETFSKNREAVFQTTVLIQYPCKGSYALGFLTSETEGEVQVKTRENVVNVFLPTTPNPTSGFLLFVPREDVIFLDMSVADGMKMIISGGVVNPEWFSQKEQNSGTLKKED